MPISLQAHSIVDYTKCLLVELPPPHVCPFSPQINTLPHFVDSPNSSCPESVLSARSGTFTHTPIEPGLDFEGSELALFVLPVAEIAQKRRSHRPFAVLFPVRVHPPTMNKQ